MLPRPPRMLSRRPIRPQSSDGFAHYPRTRGIWMNSQGEGICGTGTSIRVGPSRRLNARLSAAHVPEGTIVEHDDAQRNAMVHRGRNLVRGGEKAAVTRDRQDRYIPPRVLCTECGGEAPAEVVLIAG